MASYSYNFTITGGKAQNSSSVPKIEPTFTSNSANYLGCTSYNNVNYGTQYCVNLYNSNLASLVNQTASSIVITLNFNALPYLQYFMVGRKLASGTGNYTYARMFRTGQIAKSATSCTIDVTGFGICPYGYIIYVGDSNGTSSYTTVNSASIAITTEAAVKTIRVPLVLNAKRCSSTNASEVRSNTLAKYTVNNEPERYIGSANSYQAGYAIQALWPAAGSNGYPSGYTLSSLLQSTAAAGFSSLKLKIYHFAAGYKLGLYYGLLKGTSGSAELASTGTQLEIAKPSDSKATTCTEITLSTSTRNSYGYGVGGNISGSYAAAYANVVGMVVEGVVANYTVSYNKGTNGTGTNTSDTKTYGVALTLKGAIFTRAGYYQSGWSTTDGGSQSYALSASYTTNTAVTLYPVWTAYKVTIKYNANGGSLTTGTGTTRYRVSNNLVQKSTDSGSTWADLTATISTGTDYVNLHNVCGSSYDGGVKKTGYHIVGTSAFRAGSTSGTLINQDTTSASDTNAATIANLTGSATLTANVTVILYINWVIDTYTVSYANGGHGTAPSAQTKTYGQTLTLQPFIATNYSSETTVTITGNANGGSWSGSNGSAKWRYKYTQSNWKATDNTTYSSGGSYTTNAATTMTATWTSTAEGTSYTLPTGTPTKAATTTNSLTVSYWANGGNSTPQSQHSSKPVTYSFAGWFTSGGIQRTTNSRVTAAETVYAHYDSTTGSQAAITLADAITRSNGTSSDTYALIPNANGGTIYGGSNGSCVKTGTIPYTFNGWHEGSESGTSHAAGSSFTPSNSVTMYAGWTPGTITYSYATTLPTNTTVSRPDDQQIDSHTIYFNSNGGYLSRTSETTSKDRHYYWDTKWWTAANGGNQVTTSSQFDAATTIYPHWNIEDTAYTPVILPTANECTRPGYTLLGWSNSPYYPQGDDAWLMNPGWDYIYNGDSQADELYAIWELLNTIRIVSEDGYSLDTYSVNVVNVDYWNELYLNPYRVFVVSDDGQSLDNCS